MKDLSRLFEHNRDWTETMKETEPRFFDRLCEGQQPTYLWIGCSDSQIPANTIFGLPPGEFVVHRNLANQVIHSDLNCQSVLQYAIEVLNVEHIIVCGHYGCGGVQAALKNEEMGVLDNWIRPVKEVYQQFEVEFNELNDPKKRLDRLCELNVRVQLRNVCHSPFVQKAWQDGQQLSVHGLIFKPETGRIRDLELSVHSESETSTLYRLK